jgi:hypothetical protein
MGRQKRLELLSAVLSIISFPFAASVILSMLGMPWRGALGLVVACLLLVPPLFMNVGKATAPVVLLVAAALAALICFFVSSRSSHPSPWIELLGALAVFVSYLLAFHVYRIAVFWGLVLLERPFSRRSP